MNFLVVCVAIAVSSLYAPNMSAFACHTQTTLQDDGYLYTVFKTRVAIDLSTLLGETTFDEKTAMFYTASVGKSAPLLDVFTADSS